MRRAVNLNIPPVWYRFQLLLSASATFSLYIPPLICIHLLLCCEDFTVICGVLTFTSLSSHTLYYSSIIVHLLLFLLVISSEDVIDSIWLTSHATLPLSNRSSSLIALIFPCRTLRTGIPQQPSHHGHFPLQQRATTHGR